MSSHTPIQLKHLKLLLFAFLIILFSPPVLQAKENTVIPLKTGTEVDTSIYKAKGDTLFLWLYSEAGPQPGEDHIAQQLAKRKIETWRVDLFAAHFLPVATSSMDQLPASDMGELIEYAYRKTGKKIIPVSTGRGTLPVLEGVQYWQQHYPQSKALTGVILMSPKFFIETPEPGVEGKLLPIVTQSNLPLFVMQPTKSPWYWKLDKTIPALEKNGSDVFVQHVKNVRDRYYFRPDADDNENRVSKKLPAMLAGAAKSLKTLPYKKRVVRNTLASETRKITTGKKERKLAVYKGNPEPPALALATLDDNVIDLKKLRGKVVLVNFWASWCPPCVHEMPSMERLKNRFSSKDFLILGVNMAEDKDTIRQFLRSKVKISFPVVLDTQGEALKRWGVFAFPTSYVIDKQGRIRYALFGGIDWDKKDIVKTISRLIND